MVNVRMIMVDKEKARIWKEAIIGWCRHLPGRTDKNYETRISTPVLNLIQKTANNSSSLYSSVSAAGGEGSLGIPCHGLGNRGTPVWFQRRAECFSSSNLPGRPWGPPSEYRQLFPTAHGGRSMKVNTRLHQWRHSECLEVHLHLPSSYSYNKTNEMH